MLKNYLKVAVRSIFKHKVYSLINLAGLGIGMALCLLIYQYVTTELSYDSFHSHRDNTYRVVSVLQNDSGEWNNRTSTPMPLGPALAENFPEIRAFTRNANTSEAVVKAGNRCFTERLLYADADMFSIFTFPLISGDSSSALRDKSSVVISEAIALKYFGHKDAMGKIVSIKMGGEFRDFAVAGVAADAPRNSTISFGIVIPIEVVIERWGPPFTTSWGAGVTRTYVQLADGVDPVEFETKFPSFLGNRSGISEDRLSRTRFVLQPLENIHLNPHFEDRNEPTTNPMYLFILSGIGFMLLFIACFNFTNISIGLSSIRLREVGVRKVLGASRVRLIRQFLVESAFLSLLALCVAIALSELMLPLLNNLANADLSSGQLFDWITLPSMMLLLLVVAVMSGAYPALYLSRLNPSQILKGTQKVGGSNMFTRTLIVLQFAVSVFFIICTLFMSKQMSYVQKADLGFNNDQVLVLPVSSSDGQEILGRLKNEIGTHPSVVSISGCRASMGRESDYAFTSAESEGVEIETFVFRIDEAFVPTLQMEMVEGRNISTEYPSDPGRAVIVNEAFVRSAGWDSPLGKPVKLNFPGLGDNDDDILGPRLGKKTGMVVGVVKDFHYLSLHAPILPAVMYTSVNFPVSRIMVRLTDDDIPATIGMLGGLWPEIAPSQPFEYYFLDDDFNRQYADDERWGKVIIYSAILAILISAVGLLGVATLILSRRTKEIGIRKVLGATVSGIVRQVNREFVLLVLIANLLAWPAAHWVISRWLENFAYRVDLSLTSFILAALISMVIALATVSTQAFRAARANPVDSLKYE